VGVERGVRGGGQQSGLLLLGGLRGAALGAGGRGGEPEALGVRAREGRLRGAPGDGDGGVRLLVRDDPLGHLHQFVGGPAVGVEEDGQGRVVAVHPEHLAVGGGEVGGEAVDRGPARCLQVVVVVVAEFGQGEALGVAAHLHAAVDRVVGDPGPLGDVVAPAAAGGRGGGGVAVQPGRQVAHPVPVDQVRRLLVVVDGVGRRGDVLGGRGQSGKPERRQGGG